MDGKILSRTPGKKCN